jgi:hypothetical protein
VKKFDTTAFCKGIKAAVILENILSQKGDDKLTSKVNTHLSRFQRRLKSLDAVVLADRQYFVDFLAKDSVNFIKVYKYELPVETHLLNIIFALYRRKLREIQLLKKQANDSHFKKKTYRNDRFAEEDNR